MDGARNALRNTLHYHDSMVGPPSRRRLAPALLVPVALIASCADVIGLDSVNRVQCVGDCDAAPFDAEASDVTKDGPKPSADAGHHADSGAATDSPVGDTGKGDVVKSCTASAECPTGEACDTTTGMCTTACSSTQACNGGCCDGTMCVPGTKPSACGLSAMCASCVSDTSGNACLASGSCGCENASDCPTDEACDATTHVCSSTCSATQTCNGGCCNAGTCAAGTGQTACGATGGVCASCPTGQECASGACVCDSVSCPSGCCKGGSGGTCEAYASESTSSCGTGGASCAPCGSGDYCDAKGACLTATPQVIPFLVASLGGAWGTGGCMTTTELGTTTVGATLTASWTDTTGDPTAAVQLALNWKFLCSPGAYSVTINGSNLGAGTVPATSCVCNATSPETTSQTFSSGFSIVAYGSNTITLMVTGDAWIGIENSGSYALEVTVTP
jgi:hypothetical protein